MILDDKVIEKRRYDDRSNDRLTSGFLDSGSNLSGFQSIPFELRAPYIEYELILDQHLTGDLEVLEICAGTGEFTAPLLRSGGRVTATDISSASLDLLKVRFSGDGTLNTKIADIENLPFKNHSFDIVACAGGLSYGDNDLVLGEIYRVLRPGGKFICVDSLNNNLIYRVNRYLHYLRGNRSLSTLVRMPSKKYIDLLKLKFDGVEVSFFGSIVWLTPLLRISFGAEKTFKILNWFDRVVGVKGSAFKFVLLAWKK